MKFDLYKIAKEVFYDKNLFIEILSKNRIKVFYKNSNNRTNPKLKQFVIPRFLDLDKDFSELVGLYLGDGKTTQNDLSHLEFSSIDFDTLYFVIQTLIYKFNLKSNNFFTEIRYNISKKNKLVKRTSKLLGIPENKIKSKKVERARNPSIRIQLGGIVVRRIFEKLILESLPIIEKDELLRRAFLRGYFAAEGTVAYNRNENYLNYIGFSYNPETESWLRDYCISCLAKENVSSIFKEREGNRAEILISNWDNYWKLWSIDLFDRCERKKKRFYDILFSRNIYCKLNENFRHTLFASLNISQRQVATIINSHQGNVSRTIKGEHLLSNIQIKNLLLYANLSKQDFIKNTKSIRIGNSKSLISDRNFIETVLR